MSFKVWVRKVISLGGLQRTVDPFIFSTSIHTVYPHALSAELMR
jgi:hypothetical protein